MTNLGQLISAVVLVIFGGLFAAIDAALSTVSIARVEELVRDLVLAQQPVGTEGIHRDVRGEVGRPVEAGRADRARSVTDEGAALGSVVGGVGVVDADQQSVVQP